MIFHEKMKNGPPPPPPPGKVRVNLAEFSYPDQDPVKKVPGSGSSAPLKGQKKNIFLF